MMSTPVTEASMEIDAGQQYYLNYSGGYNGCTDVEWYFRTDVDSTWHNFAHNNQATLAKIFHSGTYELKMTARVYDGRYFFNWFGCDLRFALLFAAFLLFILSSHSF